MTNFYRLRRHVNQRDLRSNFTQNKVLSQFGSIKNGTHFRITCGLGGRSGNASRALVRNTNALTYDIVFPIWNNYFGHRRVTNGLLGINRLDETHKDDLVIEGTLLNVSFGFNHLTILLKEHLLDDLLFHDIEENNL